MVAASVDPHRHADEAGGHADRPARVDEQDRKSRARRKSRLDRFARRLVGPASLRRVLDLPVGEDPLVQEDGGFRGGFGAVHERKTLLPKARDPRLALLADACVRQDRVAERVFVDARAPRRRSPGLVRAIDVRKQEVSAERREIGVRHARDEPFHRRALLGRRVGEGARDLGAIGARADEGPPGVAGHDGRRAERRAQESQNHDEKRGNAHGGSVSVPLRSRA